MKYLPKRNYGVKTADSPMETELVHAGDTALAAAPYAIGAGLAGAGIGSLLAMAYSILKDKSAGRTIGNTVLGGLAGFTAGAGAGGTYGYIQESKPESIAKRRVNGWTLSQR